MNSFSKTLGIEFTKITINQLKILQQGENPVISLFNSFMKSDTGSQLVDQIGAGLKAYMDTSSKESAQPNKDHLMEVFKYQLILSIFEIKQNPHSPLSTQTTTQNSMQIQQTASNFAIMPDVEIVQLLERINRCCNESLVAKVGKCFRIRCVDAQNTCSEIDLDLRFGSGWCGFVTAAGAASRTVDVLITLRKETLFALVNDEISPLSAYIDGSIQIQGSVADAIKLQHLAERSKEL